MTSCPGCGLPNYEGLCPVCRGDEDAAVREGMPYPWPELYDTEEPPPERGVGQPLHPDTRGPGIIDV